MCLFKPWYFPANTKAAVGIIKQKVTLMLLFGCFLGNTASASGRFEIQQKISQLAPEGSILLHDENGKQLFSYQPEKILIPASIIKILVALAALELLGGEFRFKTGFYQDSQANLAIKGWGDPFLISEEISLISDALKRKGLSTIRGIYLDHSAYADNLEIKGLSKTLNPYDAINGALVVNFNTLNIGKTSEGKVFSAESVTPLTPLALKKSELLKPDSILRINLTNQPAESLQYAGELFYQIFQAAGISIKDHRISLIEIDRSWRLFHEHYNSHDLSSIIKGLLKYSNNFVANQIFLAIGSQFRGYPATLEKARSVFRDFVQKRLKPRFNELILDEASGISSKNRISGKMMIKVLEMFKKHKRLINLKNGSRIKSGTLSGVYNYAGYFETDMGVRPFVIMMNQKKNNRDKVLLLLKRFSSLNR